MDGILIFGGKGGVGKSSISTSTSVYLAQLLNSTQNVSKTSKKVLLVSFDIAHNLSDLFDKQIGNDITQITENLFAIEPDPDLYAESYTGKITQKTRELFKSSKLMSLFPQLEQIVEDSLRSENLPLAMKNALFFQSIIDAENPLEAIGEKQLRYIGLNQNKSTPYDERPILPPFDFMVCDFPPTGNMIALFEVPADPSRSIMKLSLKMLSAFQDSFNKLKSLTKWAKPAAWMAKKVVNQEADPTNPMDAQSQHNLAQEILDLLYEMEKRSERIAALLKGIGSLRLVSIAEKPSFEETKRARELSSPFIAVDAVHVNRLIPQSEKGKTVYLDKILATQEKYRTQLREKFSDIKIWESNFLADEPIGLEGLTRLSKEIYKDDDITDILNPMRRDLMNPEKTSDTKPIKIDEIRQQWRDA
ncbi:MAG: ArsA family ATPase [Promethearchaeota archaeon]